MQLKEEVSKIIDNDVAAREVVGALEGFDNWYFDDEDYRQAWLPEEAVDGPDGLVAAISSVYDINAKEATSDGEPFPENRKETVVGRLAGLVTSWKTWWPEYEKASEKLDWLLSKGDNAQIYEYEDYGDPEKSEGLGGIFVDENEPYGENDEGIGIFDAGV